MKISTSLSPIVSAVGSNSALGTFGNITIAARGSGPHLSFSDSGQGAGPRGDDYSAVALDTNNSDIWLATEYIPSTQDPFDNWGTRIFDIKGA